MKNKLFIFVFAIVLGACSNEDSNTADNSFDKEGPAIEINIVEKDIENSLTRIEIINRQDVPINGLRGRLLFLGEDGEPLTTATGRILDSPFSMTANPYLVNTMAKQVKKLGNKIPEGTTDMKLTELYARTKSGEVKINND